MISEPVPGASPSVEDAAAAAAVDATSDRPVFFALQTELAETVVSIAAEIVAETIRGPDFVPPTGRLNKKDIWPLAVGIIAGGPRWLALLGDAVESAVENHGPVLGELRDDIGEAARRRIESGVARSKLRLIEYRKPLTSTRATALNSYDSTTHAQSVRTAAAALVGVDIPTFAEVTPASRAAGATFVSEVLGRGHRLRGLLSFSDLCEAAGARLHAAHPTRASLDKLLAVPADARRVVLSAIAEAANGKPFTRGAYRSNFSADRSVSLTIYYPRIVMVKAQRNSDGTAATPRLFGGDAAVAELKAHLFELRADAKGNTRLTWEPPTYRRWRSASSTFILALRAAIDGMSDAEKEDWLKHALVFAVDEGDICEWSAVALDLSLALSDGVIGIVDSRLFKRGTRYSKNQRRWRRRVAARAKAEGKPLIAKDARAVRNRGNLSFQNDIVNWIDAVARDYARENAEMSATPLVVVGNGKSTATARSRAAHATQFVAKHFPLLFVSEFRTSRVCGFCHSELKPFRGSGRGGGFSTRGKICTGKPDRPCALSGKWRCKTSGEAKVVRLAQHRDKLAPIGIATHFLVALFDLDMPEAFKPLGGNGVLPALISAEAPELIPGTLRTFRIPPLTRTGAPAAAGAVTMPAS